MTYANIGPQRKMRVAVRRLINPSRIALPPIADQDHQPAAHHHKPSGPPLLPKQTRKDIARRTEEQPDHEQDHDQQ